MRRFFLLAVAGLATALWLASASSAEVKKKPIVPKPAEPADTSDSCHGTAVEFVSTPSEAAQKAKREQKLVFVLHVSGQFEDPGIT